jgi:hypothetical protein
MHWAAIVFGWPAAFTSVVLSCSGLAIDRAAYVWAGAFVGLPFMFYLFLTPGFWMFATMAALCHFGAAVALARRSRVLAWMLFLPTPLLMWYVATAVLSGSLSS